MLRTRVIPVLLLKNRGLVKTVKFKNEKYIGDPINAVKIFNEKEVDELIFLDIMASKEGREPDYEHIAEISEEAFMPFSYGGGITTITQMKKLFSIGVEKIILNNVVLKDRQLIQRAVDQFGAQSIIGAIDVSRRAFGKYKVYNHVTQKVEKLSLIEYASLLQKEGVGEVFVNSVENDGMMQGYDIEILQEIENVLEVPLVACGGAGSIDDFSVVIDKAKVSAVAAGSFFVFHGKHKAVLITYPSYQELQDRIK